jgi:hypothetical protein
MSKNGMVDDENEELDDDQELDDEIINNQETNQNAEPVEKNYSSCRTNKNIKQYEIWKVEWRNNPKNIKLVVIVQTNYLNNHKHASYLVCPLVPEDVFHYWILRLRIYLPGAGRFEILVDQITTVSGQALIERVNVLPDDIRIKLRRNLCVVLGFSI